MAKKYISPIYLNNFKRIFKIDQDIISKNTKTMVCRFKTLTDV